MSPGRAQLFAEAAVRKYGEQRARAAAIPARHEWPRDKVFLVAAGSLVLAVFAAILWGLHLFSSPSRAIPARASTVTIATQESVLARAAAALADNRLTAPSSDNALELYLQANARSPADPVARAGLAEVRDRLLARAENALLQEHWEEAAAAIETARNSGVEAGRISFLSAQLAKLKEQARAAHGRIAGKGDLAAPATVSRPAPDSRVASLVELALARLDAGKLSKPDHDSARYYIEAALSIDPNDAGAKSAERVLTSKLENDASNREAQEGFIADRQKVLADRSKPEETTATAASSGNSIAPSNANQSAPSVPSSFQEQSLAARLTLIKSVPPVYPDSARKNNIQGWVEVDFTITDSGNVENAVVHASSSSIFDGPALRAVSQWKYRTPLPTDFAPGVRSRIRIKFESR